MPAVGALGRIAGATRRRVRAPEQLVASPRALLLVFIGIASTQVGAALARTLFDDAGPAGTVFLRVLFAALMLALLWRPDLRGHSREDWRLVAGFGLALATMNLSFYQSIDRIPLGLAVTIEFLGPLGVAVAGSRRALDLFWVACAAAGILLISAPGTSGLDPLGIAFALIAGGCWAAYILLSARTGRAFPGGGGLALAMCIAAVLLVPVGVPAAGGDLLDGELLLLAAGVALLSSAIPYSAELEALRLMPEHILGVLLSIEPAVAALAGWVVLDQALGLRELGGIALVTAAVAGAVAGTPAPVPRDA
jgi:inner membrane transporter RhtA